MTDDVTMPKWLAGVVATVVAALVLGAITQGVLLYTQAALTNRELASIKSQMNKIETNVDGLRDNMGDRWTAGMQRAYALSVKGDLQAVRASLATHTALPWHREAGAEHSETKRRVTRLEEDLAELRRELRESRKVK